MKRLIISVVVLFLIGILLSHSLIAYTGEFFILGPKNNYIDTSLIKPLPPIDYHKLNLPNIPTPIAEHVAHAHTCYERTNKPAGHNHILYNDGAVLKNAICISAMQQYANNPQLYKDLYLAQNNQEVSESHYILNNPPPNEDTILYESCSVNNVTAYAFEKCAINIEEFKSFSGTVCQKRLHHSFLSIATRTSELYFDIQLPSLHESCSDILKGSYYGIQATKINNIKLAKELDSWCAEGLRCITALAQGIKEGFIAAVENQYAFTFQTIAMYVAPEVTIAYMLLPTAIKILSRCSREFRDPNFDIGNIVNWQNLHDTFEHMYHSAYKIYLGHSRYDCIRKLASFFVETSLNQKAAKLISNVYQKAHQVSSLANKHQLSFAQHKKWAKDPAGTLSKKQSKRGINKKKNSIPVDDRPKSPHPGTEVITAAGRKTYKLTDEQATKIANQLGYTPTSYFTKSGQRVFKSKKDYISYDIDNHKGGVWKLADKIDDLNSDVSRSGTYNDILNKQIGK